MLFNNITDIKDNIYNNLSNYLKDNDDIIDTKTILSLLRSYLQELKSLEEINKYQAELDKTSDNIIIQIDKGDIEYFTIDVNLEIRKLKIDKIKSTDSKVIKNFIL